MSRTVQPSLVFLLTLFGLLGGVWPSPSFGEDPKFSADAILRWRNGDELHGTLLEGEAQQVHFWETAFAEPFVLNPAQLSSLRFQNSEKKQPSSEKALFDLSLSNGDLLRGHLLSINREEITIESAPLSSPITIPRSKITRLILINGRGRGLADIGDLSEWTSMGRDRNPTDWFTNIRGELSTHQWSGNLFREIDLPELVEVQFRAQFPAGSPNLEVGLLREPQQGPMLETWDNHLVLTYGTRFAPVMTLDGSIRELHLRLFWNRLSGEVRVSDASGRHLAALVGAPPSPDSAKLRRGSNPLQPGFSILSRNQEMKLLSIEIREWNGKPVPVIDLARPRVQFRDAPIDFRTETLSLAAGSSMIEIGGRKHPLHDLLEWVLSPELTQNTVSKAPPLATSSTRIAWTTGTSLSGDFIKIASGAIVFQPQWSEEPIIAHLEGIREIRFPENAGPLETGADTLSVGKFTLHGHARLHRADGDEDPPLLAWQAPGALRAVPLSPRSRFEITKAALSTNTSSPATMLSESRLYLKDDEILSGNLISLDAETATFESRITGRITIPADRIRAVDLGTSGRIFEGFGDPEWEAFEAGDDGVILNSDAVTIQTGVFGNPSILLGDELQFEMEWKESYGAMTLRLFASGVEPSTPSTDVIIAAQGNRLFIGKLNDTGAFSFAGNQIPIADNRVKIDIKIGSDELEIFIDGKSPQKVKIDPSKVSGNGIFFKMGGNWQGWNQADSPITIREFQITGSPGSIPRRIIDPEAKKRLLAIPRSDRDHPPTHLLIASNGDLLRGRLLSLDANRLRFHVHGEELEIPRPRIANVVCLTPPLGNVDDSNDPKTPEVDDTSSPIDPFADEHYSALSAYNFRISHQMILRDGSHLQLAGNDVDGHRLIGTSPLLGICRIPLEQICELKRSPSLPLHKAASMPLSAYQDWIPVSMPDPVIPEEGGIPDSPLIGQRAPEFELSMLDDTSFSLSAHQGKVVVLNFWATWSGPCIKAMPDLTDVIAVFPAEAVVFCAINQGESAPLIKDFLSKRDWEDLPIALDHNLKVSRSFEVENIPHLVVIDPQGKISWIQNTYSPNLKKNLFEAIAKLLPH